MSALRRRTRFATPLILTVAASCGRGDGKAKDKVQVVPRYPGVTWDVTMRPTGCLADQYIECPGPTPCNPPAPREVACPPGSSGQNVIRIAERPDHTCAVLPKDCVEPGCATLEVPCPLPVGQRLTQKLAFVWHIEKRGELCHAEEEEEDCPPGVDCNPPAPRTMPCPPGASEEKDVLIAELADGTCALVPDGCTDTGCVGAKTPCPQR